MEKKHVVVLVLVVMIAEGLLAWALRPAAADAANVTTPRRSESRGRIKDGSGNDETRQLRRRIRELEAKLAERGERPARADEGERVRENDRREGPPDFANMRRDLERIAREDPERYARMTNDFARGRQWMMNRRRAKADFLASIDVSTMSEHDRDVHLRMQELTAKQDALHDLIAPDSGATDEERRAALDEARGLGHELRGLQNAERDILLGQLARNLGCDDEAAAEVISTVKEIYNMTERNDFGPGGRGGPGGGRGGWNRRGRR